MTAVLFIPYQDIMPPSPLDYVMALIFVEAIVRRSDSESQSISRSRLT